MQGKKLYRTEGPYKMIAGICGGVAEFFDIDPTIVRVVWGALAFTTIGIWGYLICWFVMPRKSQVYPDA